MIGDLEICALSDTGSSHTLLSVEVFKQLKNAPFEPMNLKMFVAGGVLNDNILGKTYLNFYVQDKNGYPVEYEREFLVAQHLNGYKCIIGADFLLNSELTVAITPNELLLKHNGDIIAVPIFSKKSTRSNTHLLSVQSDEQFDEFEEKTLIVPSTCLPIDMISVQNIEMSTMLTAKNFHVNKVFLNVNEQRIEVCIRNTSSEMNNVLSGDFIGILYYKFDEPVNCNHVFLNSKKLKIDETKEIDDECADEMVLVDPTNLDKKFSYKDCKIGNVPKSVKDKMWKVLKDLKDVFAKSKLDVGEFKKFKVHLEVEGKLVPENQRYMSPEKLNFCKKTFETFEKLNLIQRCEYPKTISNLHLVPKYEGLRDLTKASTYLAQVRGEKNFTFRIVQDLRRVNEHTTNIRKSLPILPEAILLKLNNKIVSSVDCNQAYWHLSLDEESRPWTAFYLGKKVYQFNRMAQGLSCSPFEWDSAMLEIFSPETMSEIKKVLPKHEADMLPDDFESFFGILLICIFRKPYFAFIFEHIAGLRLTV
jgi:hypothetical protein